MTTQITISAADVSAAANFLEQFLSDEVQEGDFSAGTALRDLTIKALATIVAFMRADASQIRAMQSLVTVQAAIATGDAEALTDAVTGILSNFFVAPKSGRKARGFAIGHSTKQVDIFIPTIVKFTYSTGLVFVVDASDTLFIPAAELVPIVDADSVVLDYEFRIPLVASQTGEAYNVEAALFADFDRFSPYVTRVEATNKFSGGGGQETISEILERAPTAVSVRNLINERSIEATLEDNFDGIDSTLVIGYGFPEMQRDLVPGVAPHLKFHIGGMTDIYLRTALVETEFTGAVGDLFTRSDGVAAMFRDSSANFLSGSPVLAGDIIRITDGLPTVPSEHMVIEVLDAQTLVVSERSPFPVATDEAGPPTTVSYTIGRAGPTYNDIRAGVAGIPLTTGVTSRQVAMSGRITLPGGPVMDILDIAIINPPVGEAAFKSNLDGFVHFPNQVNNTPAQSALPDAGLQFQTIVHSPGYAQTALQWMEIVVGTDTFQSRFDGLNLRVRYRTLSTFQAIDDFVRGRRERITAAFTLPKGHHPVSLRMNIQYSLKATATALLNDDTIAQAVVDFINAFDATSTPIDVSAITTMLHNSYPDIGPIEPVSIQYDLRAPDGSVLTYETVDVVRVLASKQISGPVLDLDDIGVTDRTLRYIANVADVTVEVQ